MKPSNMKMCVPYIVTESNVVENIDSPKISKGDIIYYTSPDKLCIEHYTEEDTQYFTVQKFQIEDENNISNFEVEIFNTENYNTFLYFSDDSVSLDYPHYVIQTQNTGHGYNYNLSPDEFFGISSRYKPHEKVYYYVKDNEQTQIKHWGYGEIEYILFDGSKLKYVIRKENGALDTFEYTKGELRYNFRCPDVIIYY